MFVNEARLGPGFVVEMVNSMATIYDRAGTELTSFDLKVFFGLTAGYEPSDPRVIWDGPAGRWFASIMSFDNYGNGQVLMAVSQTADPAGQWRVTMLRSTTGTIHDQPRLGVFADKVLVGWDDFDGTTFGYRSSLTAPLRFDWLRPLKPPRLRARSRVTGETGESPTTTCS